MWKSPPSVDLVYTNKTRFQFFSYLLHLFSTSATCRNVYGNAWFCQYVTAKGLLGSSFTTVLCYKTKNCVSRVESIFQWYLVQYVLLPALSASRILSDYLSRPFLTLLTFSSVRHIFLPMSPLSKYFCESRLWTA